MPHSSLAVAGPVHLCCPACGASEEADPAALGDDPTIVCPECGETWPGEAVAGTEGAAEPAPRALSAVAPTIGGPELEAERRPLVTYSDGADKAWAAKMEGDYWPEPPQRSRVPAVAAALAAAIFLAGFFGGREAAVAALPDLAGFYAAMGLPVRLDPLVIEDVAAERAPGPEGTRLTVRGIIRNVSGTEQPVPSLSASVHDSAMAPTGWRAFDAPARLMKVDEAAPFRLELEGVPEQSSKVVIRFRRPSQAAAGAPPPQ